MMNLVLWGSVIWLAPLICYMLVNETKSKKNLVLAVTLPAEGRSDPEVEASGMLKVIDGSNFAFAADSGKVAALIKKMLSLPQKGITNIQLCEKFITEYCGILAENDRLPDMEIPGRFIPSSRGISTGGALDVMLEMHVEQDRGTEGTHSWSEKRFLRLPDREVRNIPLNFHRSVWKASSPYRVNFDNILFLTVVEKKLYYRVLNDPDKLLVIRLNGNDAPCFGEFSKDDNLSFSLNEEGKETHCIAVSPRIREVTS